MKQPVIFLENVSKTYLLYRSGFGRLQDWLMRSTGRAHRIESLKDIGFSVYEGERLVEAIEAQLHSTLETQFRVSVT